MDLINFHIKNYKVVSDSTAVRVDPRVTALVGKNESGKSAILQALWKSRNAANVDFDHLYDYPRGTHQRNVNDRQETTILEFELSPEESNDLVIKIPDVFSEVPTRIIHKTSYDAKNRTTRTICFDVDTKALASGERACQAISSVINAIAEQNRRRDGERACRISRCDHRYD